MSGRIALAREIAARTTPRFIEIKPEKRDRRPILLNGPIRRGIVVTVTYFHRAKQSVTLALAI